MPNLNLNEGQAQYSAFLTFIITEDVVQRLQKYYFHGLLLIF